MRQLTMGIIRAINTDFCYEFSEQVLQDIYSNLTTIPGAVSMTDIIEEFEYIAEKKQAN